MVGRIPPGPPTPGWNRGKVSENLGATMVYSTVCPCGYIPEVDSLFQRTVTSWRDGNFDILHFFKLIKLQYSISTTNKTANWLKLAERSVQG